jgi:hypothetical protein
VSHSSAGLYDQMKYIRVHGLPSSREQHARSRAKLVPAVPVWGRVLTPELLHVFKSYYTRCIWWSCTCFVFNSEWTRWHHTMQRRISGTCYNPSFISSSRLPAFLSIALKPVMHKMVLHHKICKTVAIIVLALYLRVSGHKPVTKTGRHVTGNESQARACANHRHPKVW